VIRRKPLPADVHERLASLGDALAAEPQIVFAYLFGSASRGALRPLSDVDVAIFLADGSDRIEARLRAIGLVSGHLGSDEVDVIVLNDAPSALVGRILATGASGRRSGSWIARSSSRSRSLPTSQGTCRTSRPSVAWL
jgi:predicted nucleotidyltransferase